MRNHPRGNAALQMKGGVELDVVRVNSRLEDNLDAAVRLLLKHLVCEGLHQRASTTPDSPPSSCSFLMSPLTMDSVDPTAEGVSQ